MLCPVDGATLVMTERSGVEIDYCPTCRGVWLDRGELDKIIERGSAPAAPAAPGATPVYQAEPRGAAAPPPRRDDRYRRDDDDDDYDRDGRRYPRKRRESFLSDLFDF
jgi:Zn-finger nucleic acid-binding protein